MSETTPKVGAGGLVTVAFLKARLDEGEDQLGIFSPLVLDAVSNVPNRYFTAADVQEVVAARHGISMPQETVTTLLKRATRRGFLVRDAGRFIQSQGRALPRSSVSADKATVEAGQLRLGAALAEHARESKGLELTQVEALDLLLRFLEEHQVSRILGVPDEVGISGLSNSETAIIAEFLRDIVEGDHGLAEVLKGILEGLVLYHAAFLPDLNDVSRRFVNLTVVFDSVLVRQALGYEGTAPRAVLRETVDLLAASGIRCVVLDKTVQEIQRILRMYQEKLATTEGRRSLRPFPMARHFLTQRYSPSDVQEMSALLEGEIQSAGFSIQRTPQHVARYTLDEAKLASRLADPRTRDVAEPRVEHDVDSVAAVLTLRAGHRAYRIEEARVVFATISPLVIRNTQLWWAEDELETSVAPIVHIRALANLAWLKRPTANPEFQIRDLVALCAAAMRPSQKMWRRFLAHLDELHNSDRLSTDQVTAIIVSTVSDRLLRSLEPDDDDPADVDAGTLDEVVDRVISEYSANAQSQLEELGATYETRLAATQADADTRASLAETAARNASELLRRRDLEIDGRARRWAKRTGAGLYWAFVPLVLVASLTLAVQVPYGQTWFGVLGALGLLVVGALELAGVLGQLREFRTRVETYIHLRLRSVLGGESPARTDSRSDEI
jgi:hypothetical protein